VTPDHFLAQVMLPLCQGGPVEVAAPLDSAAYDEVRRLAVGAELAELAPAVAIARARRRVAAEVVLAPPTLALDEEAVRLAVGLYDALFLTHPDARRHRIGVRQRVAEFAGECAALGAPATRSQLIGRHTVVHNLFRVGRTDHRVSFWVGKREFRGRKPPQRLLRWPGVRRVQVQTVRLNWYRQAGVPAPARQVVRHILEASPLTDLLNPVRLDPPLALAVGLKYLSDPEIARFVAYEYLKLGLPQVAAPLSAALAELVGERPGGPEVRAALAFVCHLHVLEAMVESAEAQWLSAEGGPARAPEARDFLAAFAAAWGRGHVPPGIELEAGLSEKLARRADLCERIAGAARVEALAAALGPPAPGAC